MTLLKRIPKTVLLLCLTTIAFGAETETAKPAATLAPPAPPKKVDLPVLADKALKSLESTEFTSLAFPQLSVGFIVGDQGRKLPAIAYKGEDAAIWRFPKRVLTIFECEDKPCANDASGRVYQLNKKQWQLLDVRLRPWTTLVHYVGKKFTGCIKPTVVKHSGVKAYCYAADRTWRQNYLIRSPHPQICGKSLRLIQQESHKTWLLDLALPSGKVNSKIAVEEPFKPVCEYKGPIKPADAKIEPSELETTAEAEK